MTFYIVANIIVLLCIAALTWFFSDGDMFDRNIHAAAVAVIGFQVSLLGWVIYVAVHFISKYW